MNKTIKKKMFLHRCYVKPISRKATHTKMCLLPYVPYLVFVKCDTNYVWNKLNHENKKRFFIYKLETRQRQLLTRVYNFAVLL